MTPPTPVADLSQIRRFLLDFKQVASRRGVDLAPRSDTLETLRYLGLTKQNLEEILLSLSVVDYSGGPEPDRDRPGEIWVFGKQVEEHKIYIKLKLADVGDDVRIAKCISFHIAARPLRYPHARSVTG